MKSTLDSLAYFLQYENEFDGLTFAVALPPTRQGLSKTSRLLPPRHLRTLTRRASRVALVVLVATLLLAAQPAAPLAQSPALPPAALRQRKPLAPSFPCPPGWGCSALLLLLSCCCETTEIEDGVWLASKMLEMYTHLLSATPCLILKRVCAIVQPISLGSQFRGRLERRGSSPRVRKVPITLVVF
jgi:hypothetical protein